MGAVGHGWSRELPRRDALRLAGLGGVAVLAGGLVGCTRATGGSGSSSSSSNAGGSARASTPSYATLASRISGGLLRPGAAGYAPSNLLYNPRFANQPAPAAIAHCRTAADVVACVQFAADGGAPLRLRNGGHSYGGWSSGPGLVADLGGLGTVAIDSAAMTATVGAGALLVDVYTALAAAGLSIGAGSCPTVGVTGLALGGGVGVLTGSYGLTCDQIRAFSVVTADGRTRTVDADADGDLFWALRGGGGSFAAVTSLTFAVRPAPTITRFYLAWPWSAASNVLSAWQQWAAGTPRELWSTCKLLVDPGQGFSVSVSGTWVGSGPIDGPLQALLAATPKPSTDQRSVAGYGPTMLAEAGCSGLSAAACVADALAPAQRQPFAATSSILADALPDAGVAVIVEAVTAGAALASMVEGGVSFDSLGGAVTDVATADTAFPWRSALAVVQYTATWAATAAADDPTPFDSFVHDEREALTPWLGAAAYVNYADASLTDYASAYWGANLPRLQQVKRSYDPHDVFAFPQSVPL